MDSEAALCTTAAGPIPRRLFTFSGGFLRDRRLRRILQLAGHDICLGHPGPEDGVVVWGQTGPARRGQAVARRLGLPLITVEDAFLRSLHPGRTGDPPLGLMLDPAGVHYDAAKPSLLEAMLHTASLQNSNLADRALAGIERIRYLDLSKYNFHDPTLACPEPGYVLVIDQTRRDASLLASGANDAIFQAMLARAKADHPTANIVLKSHPETTLGLRPGHFTRRDTGGTVALLTAPVSPWRLLDGAIAVYTVSSHLGFEAILAGHKPHVFGTPFYAGWGLSHDEITLPRRTNILTAPQLFAAAMIAAPTYFDPCRNRLCSFEEVLDHLEAETRSLRADRCGYVATGMRVWKHRHLQAFYGGQTRLRFAKTPQKAAQIAETSGRGLLIWAGKEPARIRTNAPILRVEDGFLRSRGLGANLVAPLSLVDDDLGIYYDPTRPSRLEALIAGPLPPGGSARAERLIAMLLRGGVTKYNLVGQMVMPAIPKGPRILVPGQVEDDASILKGAPGIRSNLALLQAARAANPDAILIYKPHPDVEAGLRPGAIPEVAVANLADVIVHDADAATCIDLCDAVWTITSTFGFEALLRGKPVTCLGVPFYAGWGLTDDLCPSDLCPATARRASLSTAAQTSKGVTMFHLAHAALIAYPRYFDPVSRRPCPPEIAVERLINGPVQNPGAVNRAVAKLQGRFASYAYLWRKT